MKDDSPADAARAIIDWVELSGEGPAEAWPTTCSEAVKVARAYLRTVEALETFAHRADTPGADKVPDDGTVTFFMKDVRDARAALAGREDK